VTRTRNQREALIGVSLAYAKMAAEIRSAGAIEDAQARLLAGLRTIDAKYTI
jgi:hypothetical protein